MAKILVFQYGEGVVYDDDIKNIKIMNPITDIVVDILPTQYTFSCACVITGFDNTRKNKVRHELKSENGDLLNKGSYSIEPWPEKMSENTLYGVNIGIDFRNVLLTKTETLTTYLYFNDEVIGDYPINVIRKEGDENAL